MKIVFISNKITPHQIPICNELARDHEFLFIETMKGEVIDPGWQANGYSYSNVIPYTEDKGEKLEILSKIIDADVVICGSAPDSYIKSRLKKRKLTFKYAERFYKTGLGYRKIIRAILGTWLHHGRFQRFPLYMLCASAYTSADCAKFGNYTNRVYKWGYFPETKQYDLQKMLLEKHNTNVPKLLWVGRLVEWKHPEVVIELASKLKKAGYHFSLTIIGYGALENSLETLINSKDVNDVVSMLGKMSPEEVRTHMEKANIFLFTSNFEEGWGAVLNEAMNSACAVVASHSIGSVPYLIRHKENGMIYSYGNNDMLFDNIRYLLENPDEQDRMGKAAYKTIIEEWNEKVAAERLVQLSEQLLSGNMNPDLYCDGPCSKAEIIENDWFAKNNT